MERFNSRLVYVHEGLREFLRTLAALGGYCTVQQAKSLGIAGWDKGVRGRLRMLERLRFLRRVTKYPVVYQVTKATTRLLGQDSSIRRRHTLVTGHGRRCVVTFSLEASDWRRPIALAHAE